MVVAVGAVVGEREEKRLVILREFFVDSINVMSVERLFEELVLAVSRLLF